MKIKEILLGLEPSGSIGKQKLRTATAESRPCEVSLSGYLIGLINWFKYRGK
jgi:hypothetical protein